MLYHMPSSISSLKLSDFWSSRYLSRGLEKVDNIFPFRQGCSVTSGGQLVKECCLWIGRDLENRYDLLNVSMKKVIWVHLIRVYQQLFLKKGADPLVRFKKNGMTVLHISALFGNIAACSSLRDREDVLTKGMFCAY